MIIYEVNLFVNREIEADYRKWLSEHIKDMLSLSHFNRANLYEINEPKDKTLNFCVHYELDCLEDLDNYIENHSVKMRNEAMELFEGKFHANRRVLIKENL